LEPPPFITTPLPPLTVITVLAKLRQTITTESCQSMCKHWRRQQVYDGTVEATLSFMLIRNLGSTSLCVRVRYQACTELECLPSASMSQEVVLEGLDLIRD
jgi:hypothetical protein